MAADGGNVLPWRYHNLENFVFSTILQTQNMYLSRKVEDAPVRGVHFLPFTPFIADILIILHRSSQTVNAHHIAKKCTENLPTRVLDIIFWHH